MGFYLCFEYIFSTALGYMLQWSDIYDANSPICVSPEDTRIWTLKRFIMLGIFCCDLVKVYSYKSSHPSKFVHRVLLTSPTIVNLIRLVTFSARRAMQGYNSCFRQLDPGFAL